MQPILENGIISSEHLAAGRAVDQLRRQLGIVFKQDSGVVTGAVPLEGLTPELHATLPEKKRSLLITGARANTLKLSDGKNTTVCFDASSWSLQDMQALADPLKVVNAKHNIKHLAEKPEHKTLIRLTKHATLLPALLLIENDTLPAHWLTVNINDITAYWASPPLDMVPVAEANLPISGAENARIHCFRSRFGTSTHLALLIGAPEKHDAPLVRVHSSCITGDILGSLRCDCGDQLQLALSQIEKAGHGVLLYLHQEGRGIGIANKIRAYALQEKGIDTYDANLMLGFDEDERDFTIAAAMLKKLGITHIRLMTNNPAKVENLERYGIDITGRVPVKSEPSKHNHTYLEAKIKKSGHLF